MSDDAPIQLQQQLDDRITSQARANKHAADLDGTPEGAAWAKKATSLQPEIDQLRKALGQ